MTYGNQGRVIRIEIGRSPGQTDLTSAWGSRVDKREVGWSVRMLVTAIQERDVCDLSDSCDNTLPPGNLLLILTRGSRSLWGQGCNEYRTLVKSL